MVLTTTILSDYTYDLPLPLYYDITVCICVSLFNCIVNTSNNNKQTKLSYNLHAFYYPVWQHKGPHSAVGIFAFSLSDGHQRTSSARSAQSWFIIPSSRIHNKNNNNTNTAILWMPKSRDSGGTLLSGFATNFKIAAESYYISAVADSWRQWSSWVWWCWLCSIRSLRLNVSSFTFRKCRLTFEVSFVFAMFISATWKTIKDWPYKCLSSALKCIYGWIFCPTLRNI